MRGTTSLKIEIEHAEDMSEEEILEAGAILALLRLRRVKPDGIDIDQLVDTQRMIESELGLYGCAFSPEYDVGRDWQPEEGNTE